MDRNNDDAIAHFFGGTGAPAGRSHEPNRDFSLDTPETSPFAAADETDDDGEIAVDVYQTETDVVIMTPLAGVKPEDIEISGDDDSITITGERKAEHKERTENFSVQEIYWGSFSRTVTLPAPCDVDKAAASFKHGVLTVKVPKTGKAKKRVIKVKTDE